MAEPVEGLSPMTRLIRSRSGVTHETLAHRSAAARRATRGGSR
jgi:hypothetical protein